MWRIIKGDNILISASLIAVGIILAFATIIVRLGSCQPPPPEPSYDYTFKIKQISYIKLKRSLLQVKLVLPSLPEFSETWAEEPQVLVNWTIKTRGDEAYRGQSIGVLAPPYSTFIFSLQDDLEESLRLFHTEQLIINEYRYRILRDVTELAVEIVHAETGEVLDSFVQKYTPDKRPSGGFGS